MNSRRTSSASKRPVSAIFLGATPTSSIHLPDLPEPPASPHSTSGLPSPPATNSTGSGSTGDNNSANAGSIRLPSSAIKSATMHNGESSSSNGQRSSSRSSSVEEEETNDEDNTARLSDDRLPVFTRSSTSTSDASKSTVQRVQSLAERNRIVLDKLAALSSGSRLSTPSPPNLRRISRSPAPSATSSRISNTSSNLRRQRSESVSLLSGSETEKESFPTESPADDISPESNIPPPQMETITRQRRLSAPSSPSKRATQSTSQEGLGDSATVGRRTKRPESRAGEVEAAALAAVASARRSPSDGRRRQPLPREFRERTSLDGRPPREPPPTPHQELEREILRSGRASPSPGSRASPFDDSPQSPRRRTQRFSTVREMTRRHQTRWLSQDLSSSTIEDEVGRVQTRRGGSNESPLAGFGLRGRSVVGESLRAAGLTRRRDDQEDDVFRDDTIPDTGRRSRLSTEMEGRTSLELGSRVTPRIVGRPSARPGSSDGVVYDPQTPVGRQPLTRTQLSFSARPSTSMATYQQDEPRTAPPFLRTHKSAFPITERDRIGQASADTVPRPPSRAPLYSTPPHDSSTALVRRTPLNAAANAAASSNADHIHLLLDSLNMFESQLARLPSMGSTTTVTIPELFRSAQNIVHQSNTLNTLIRNGTTYALENQIEADVEASVDDTSPALDPVLVWRDVGAQFRDCQRVSDELIRTTTSFLLGVGRLLRESSAEKSHNRTTSLDESVSTARRLTPELGLGVGRPATSGGGRSSDGRSSIDMKQSWVSSSGEMSVTSGKSLPSIQGSNSSQLTSVSSSSRSSAGLRARFENEPGAGSGSPSEAASRALRLTQSTRRLSALKNSDLLDGDGLGERPRSSVGVNRSVENTPSTIVASTFATNRDAPRRVNTISIPPPLPTLPSETLLTRSVSVASKNTARRQKMSTASNATVRANSIFPSLSTSNPTTAVTTTAVSVSSERPQPKLRGLGTISRAAGAAIADLQQHIQRDNRPRTISDTTVNDARPIMSGSETERDWRTTADRPRMSLDSNPGLSRSTTIGRSRRGTVTGLFARN